MLSGLVRCMSRTICILCRDIWPCTPCTVPQFRHSQAHNLCIFPFLYHLRDGLPVVVVSTMDDLPYSICKTIVSANVLLLLDPTDVLHTRYMYDASTRNMDVFVYCFSATNLEAAHNGNGNILLLFDCLCYRLSMHVVCHTIVLHLLAMQYSHI